MVFMKPCISGSQLGKILPLGDIWQCLETFWVVTVQEGWWCPPAGEDSCADKHLRDTRQTPTPSKSYPSPDINSTKTEVWLPGRHHSHPQFMKGKLRHNGRKPLGRDTPLVNDGAGIGTQVSLTLKPTLTTPAHALSFRPLLERADAFQSAFSSKT